MRQAHGSHCLIPQWKWPTRKQTHHHPGQVQYSCDAIQISAGYKTGNAIHAAVTEEDTSTAVFCQLACNKFLKIPSERSATQTAVLGQLACNKFLKIPSECIATQIPILYKTAIDSRTPFTDLYCAKR